jgi:hypothetical protein
LYYFFYSKSSSFIYWLKNKVWGIRKDNDDNRENAAAGHCIEGGRPGPAEYLSVEIHIDRECKEDVIQLL